MSPTILLVEDDDDIREAIFLSLDDEGVGVATAASGSEAFDYLASHDLPRAILLDLNMPDMTGAEFYSRLKLDPALAGVPVLLLSADADLKQKAAALGVAGYCKKPVGLDHLLNLIRPFCE